jgi:hypothetical protein
MAPGHLHHVCTALRDGNAPALRESAHRLRGLLSAFSTTAADAALRLEVAATAGRLEGAEADYATLAGMVAGLGPLLHGLSVDDLKARLA